MYEVRDRIISNLSIIVYEVREDTEERERRDEKEKSRYRDEKNKSEERAQVTEQTGLVHLLLVCMDKDF